MSNKVMKPALFCAYIICLKAIFYRESLRFYYQKSRLVSSIVRPLLWLMVFAAGFRTILGLSIIPPYETYILYEEYITPGLLGMIMLFSGMQHSLSMVYDRDVGSMKILLVAPFPRVFLLFGKLLSGTIIAVLQAYVFLLIALFWEIQPPLLGYIYFLPAAMLVGMMVNAFGLLISSLIRQLDNFAGVMNFVIFPVFFTSSALYPLWRIQESGQILYQLARLNPFTHGVETLRFSLYGQCNGISITVCVCVLLVCFWSAVFAYNPSVGFVRRKTE